MSIKKIENSFEANEEALGKKNGEGLEWDYFEIPLTQAGCVVCEPVQLFDHCECLPTIIIASSDANEDYPMDSEALGLACRYKSEFYDPRVDISNEEDFVETKESFKLE